MEASALMTTAPDSWDASQWPRIYSGPNLLQIAMPMGGIGAGCICLNGYGGLQDFSIRNKPATTALPDGHGFTESAFALLHIRSPQSIQSPQPMTRLVEGPLAAEKVYNQGLYGQGFRKGGHEGLPRFENCRFAGQYPFGTVHLTDPAVPVKATVEGWSPFIPLDDRNSGIPCAILNYTLENVSAEAVTFDFSYHMAHPAVGRQGDKATRNSVIPGKGVCFYNAEEPGDATFGSVALVVAGHSPAIKAMWFRGGWFDSISALWREVSTGTFAANDGSASERGLDGRNGGSLLVSGNLAPGEAVRIPIVITWYFPNCHYSIGIPGDTGTRVWHPYYTSQWKSATEVADRVLANLDDLYRRTAAFRDALFSSTLPSSVLDAVSANLGILKSPTVLRQANGNLWGWEGCFAAAGCCHGSCTHVWNYAQAFPHLFPALERTLRELEYLRSIDLRGHVNFRSALPDSQTTHDFHAASDGQLGGILKLYREWQIGGDTEWLRRLYPLAQRSLDYCIAVWDPDRRGALIEPHHNTYDIEFWGPDGMCSSIYLGALSGMALMARALGNDDDAKIYEEIAERGAAFLDTELFNGEYYEQQVQWEGLRDTSFADEIARIPDDDSATEMERLLKAEGPKYQYGSGCLSDGVIGAWMASLYGVETPLSRENVRNHLKAIFTHNFKPDLSEHACLQRPGYAIGHEAGLLLCTWPHGGKPTLPFVYSDEVWTGIEYQVASHLIHEGLVEEGLMLVDAVRSRYDGHVRNPYNEYECGNYYARALASYALLNSLSGFRYSAVTNTLWFGPKRLSDRFTTFFSAATGFGTIQLDLESLTITMVEGELSVETLNLIRDGDTLNLTWGATAQVGRPSRIVLC
jgi:uncharacterized protein (DUF608 family)